MLIEWLRPMPKSPCTSGVTNHQRLSIFVCGRCLFSLHIGKATVGVEFLGRRRKAGDAYEPSEHSSFRLYVLGLV